MTRRSSGFRRAAGRSLVAVMLAGWSAVALAQQTPAANLPKAPPVAGPRLVGAPEGLPVVSREDIFLFGMRFPEYLAGYRRGNLNDYEQRRAGLGYSLAYANAKARATVYVYDLGVSILPPELNSNTVQQQFSRAQNDVLGNIGEGQGRYTKAVQTRSFMISDDRGAPQYICAAFEIEQDGKTHDSYLCLTSWSDRFVKFRVSMNKDPNSQMEATRFVAAWSGLLWPQAQRAKADSLRGQRFLTLLYQARAAQQRCGMALTSAQLAKADEVERKLLGHTGLSPDEAKALRARAESRLAAAGDLACDPKGPIAADFKAVSETMLAP